MPEYTPATEDTPRETTQLHDDHVVGNAVCVTHHCSGGSGMIFLAFLETMVEDFAGERDEEEDVCDVECGEDEGARSGHEAVQV